MRTSCENFAVNKFSAEMKQLRLNRMKLYANKDQPMPREQRQMKAKKRKHSQS